METNEKQAAYIEEAGLFFESLGLTRMAGRIQGLLMVTNQDMVSFEEIVSRLKASKSSISTNLRTLVQIRFIKPVTLPGDRKTYYSLSSEIDWMDYFEQRLKIMDQMLAIYEKGLNLRKDKGDKPSQWLKKTITFYAWLAKEMPALMQKGKGQFN